MNWVRDPARFKIWLKSRQIGGSLATAFEVVADALQTGQDWVILSAGERQALEFMEKVQRVADIFAQGIQQASGQPYQPDTKVSQIRFPNGARILALPANPATARGYSANLVLDEFAFQENPSDIWRAVYPIISNPLRGNLKVRILSTPSGLNNKFADLWHDAPDFSRHRTTIHDAAAQGLAINIDELRDNLNDADGWAQEFECQFMEHASQVFPLDLISSVEHLDATTDQPPSRSANPYYIGIDIGRHRDLTVCWTLERVGGRLWTREILVLKSVPYPEQEAEISQRLRYATRAAIDATGIGGPVSEHLAATLTEKVLEPVTFTNAKKQDLFSRTKKIMQARQIALPVDPPLRDDLASVQRLVTPTGLVKYLAARSTDGHADRATALTLATYAADPSLHNPGPIPFIDNTPKPPSLRSRPGRRFRLRLA